MKKNAKFFFHAFSRCRDPAKTAESAKKRLRNISRTIYPIALQFLPVVPYDKIYKLAQFLVHRTNIFHFIKLFRIFKYFPPARRIQNGVTFQKI